MDDLNTKMGILDAQEPACFAANGSFESGEHARWKILAKRGPFAVATDACTVWVGNTRDIAGKPPASFEDLKASLLQVGQTVPAIARVCAERPQELEIIAGACRLAAIRKINDGRLPTEQMPIIVELRDLTDEEAIKVVDAENRGRSGMSPIEKARFYARAIPVIYATESLLADALGLDKSTVNRTLAIVRLPPAVLNLIEDHHKISAAQASGFLADWNKPELQESVDNAIAELALEGQSSAASVFKKLASAILSPPEIAPTIILHDGVELGSIRRGKSGATMKLSLAARDVGLDDLIGSIGEALKAIGFN